MAGSVHPLSLEDQCLLQLICHLEDHETEMLASLPLRLRRKLLLNLPAVDICLLEGTTVTEDIDMEKDVWGELGEVPGGEAYVDVDQVAWGEPEEDARGGANVYFAKPSNKQRYFGHVYKSVFGASCRPLHASHLLFSACRCLGVSNWESFQHSFTSELPDGLYIFPTPSRHVQSSTKDLLLLQLLLVVVHVCHCWPDSLEVDCTKRTGLWRRQGVVVMRLLSQLFCEIKSLKLSDDERNEGYEIAPQEILEPVFTKPTSTLSSLGLVGGGDFVCCAVAVASLFFSPTCCAQGQRFLQSLCPQSLDIVPYSGLTSITIGPAYVMQAEERALSERVQSMVQYQSNLESLTFGCSLVSPHALNLHTILGRLFLQPQFRTLRLELANLGWEGLDALVRPFLMAPLGQGHEQELCIADTSLKLRCGPVSRDVNVDGCLCVPGKALCFEAVDFEKRKAAVPFFNWLLRYRCPELLSSFQFESDDIVRGLMSLVAESHRVAQLRTFVVSYVSLRVEPSPEVPFINLFSASHLWKVSLKSCRIVRDGLLPCLTEGLQKQVPAGVLEELYLADNGLGNSKRAEFQDFASAVVNLPQLTKLTLDLQYNQLKPHQFVLLHRAWKAKAGCPKMNCLNVSGNLYQSQAFAVQEISAGGDFLNYDIVV